MVQRGELIDDRYKIIKTIGEGGMANVYLAYDTILEREVAVKILRGDLADDEKFVRRFQREANAASSLKHPNIVEMYDVGEDKGRYFIVMEYISGKTLKSLIKKRGALTLPEVLDIMSQLTSAVACAHDSYIIHRDIKPQNVMFLEDGRVKITDFGIAMALNSNELTQTNSVMGSVHYLPPEQANGSGSTMKSDIYSLGILMYELLTGKLPFKGDNAVEIAIKQMKKPIPSVREYNDMIPQSVENIILKACAKNPKNRYDSVVDMYEDVKTALDPLKKDEARITYRYPENDLDDTKVMPNLKELNTRRERSANFEEPEEDINPQNKKRKPKKGAIIGAIIAGVVLLGIITTIIVAKNTNTLVQIPDHLVGKDYDLVEEKLEDLGLNVKEKKQYSEKYKKDKVINVRPKEKRKVKKGSTVTITISKGEKTVKIEDYVGQDVEEVTKKLEKAGLVVKATAEKISKDSSIKENAIISQSISVGQKAKSGETIELTYATLVTLYPDFVNQNYSRSQVETFCSDNGITCNFKEKATTDKADGAIIDQSRTAGSELEKGQTLDITIAKMQTFTVKFNLNGGTGSIKSQTVNSGETADEPLEPTKDECIFKGWYLNKVKYNFTKAVKSDITLIANWEC